MGGTTASGGRLVVLSGTPQLAVGDEVVATLVQDGICQFAGLEHGVFWRKWDSGGHARIVDSRGRALASLGEKSPVLSSLRLGNDASLGGTGLRPAVPAGPFTNERAAPAAVEGAAPAARAEVILEELRSFAEAYMHQGAPFRSTEDLHDAPALTPNRAPEIAEGPR